jgi:hypothetical protein
MINPFTYPFKLYLSKDMNYNREMLFKHFGANTKGKNTYTESLPAESVAQLI